MKKIYVFLMVSLLTVSLFSCSKDDEPQDYTPTYDGVSIYLNAIEKFYDNDGMPAYTATDQPGVYVAASDSYEISYNFIANILENPEWDGKDVTVKLGKNGESGILKIIGSTPSLLNRGIYNEIIININDYEPYTLEIITTEQADNGYYGGGVVKKLTDEKSS